MSRPPSELFRHGALDELFFGDLPLPAERREIIQIYARRGLNCELPDQLTASLVELSDGFSGADIESAVREIVKEAYLRGDSIVTDELFHWSFQNVVPLSKTSPEQIEAIRAWGRERAVPASGQPIARPNQTRTRRTMLV